ncbi:MAG: response regulator transcription factor [Acidimicrobiales bacterium]
MAASRRAVDAAAARSLPARLPVASQPVPQRAGLSGRILVVEDDEELLSVLGRHLGEEGFAVEMARDGEEALALLLERHRDGGPSPIGAVVLDLLLPVLNGREVCHRLRAAGCWVPVLMATAFGELDDRLQGFHEGADDYLVKPFSLAELVVRLHAVMRRRTGELEETIGVGDLRLDVAARRVWRARVEVLLTPRELSLLELLMRRPGIVLTRDTIVVAVWGRGVSVSPNLLEQYVARLRRKLDAPFGRADIETVLRVGYRLKASR